MTRFSSWRGLARGRSNPLFISDLRRHLARTPDGRRRCFRATAAAKDRRRRAESTQARGPDPHRRPQDHNCIGQRFLASGWGNRGWWRKPARAARRRHCERGGAARIPMHVYMGEGHAPAGDSTSSGWSSGARSRPSRRQPHAQEAIAEAMRDGSQRERHPLRARLVLGPHPYPTLLCAISASSGTRPASRSRAEGRMRTARRLRRRGSNSIGLFHAFLEDREVRMFGSRRAARIWRRAARGAIRGRQRGSCTHPHVHPADADGNVEPTHSSRPGSTTPPSTGARRPSRCRTGDLRPAPTTRRWPLPALAVTEGILPALESAHAMPTWRANRRAAGLGSS